MACTVHENVCRTRLLAAFRIDDSDIHHRDTIRMPHCNTSKRANKQTTTTSTHHPFHPSTLHASPGHISPMMDASRHVACTDVLIARVRVCVCAFFRMSNMRANKPSSVDAFSCEREIEYYGIILAASVMMAPRAWHEQIVLPPFFRTIIERFRTNVALSNRRREPTALRWNFRFVLYGFACVYPSPNELPATTKKNQPKTMPAPNVASNSNYDFTNITSQNCRS